MPVGVCFSRYVIRETGGDKLMINWAFNKDDGWRFLVQQRFAVFASSSIVVLS